ncbi:MAG TPA: hypothetical protein VGC77_09940 [Rhodopseudomonas sp.]|uniref:hypothetical protein n=1 Tax=Rhodopseudomonas sp. TaxID=1078 RepID=UPI002EDA050E
MPVTPAQFDAFGEPVEYAEPRLPSEQGQASRWLTRAGAGLFWALLVAIVAARAAFFNPDFAASFAEFASAIRTVFGA